MVDREIADRRPLALSALLAERYRKSAAAAARASGEVRVC